MAINILICEDDGVNVVCCKVVWGDSVSSAVVKGGVCSAVLWEDSVVYADVVC